LSNKSENQILGQQGEQLAANFLKHNGYRILSRNWKCQFGELDIVAEKSEGRIFRKIKTIIFVEVKTIDAADVLFESQAEQNVHYFKQRHLIKSAECYLKSNKISPKIPWQIDVVAIEFDSRAGLHKIRHLERAVWQR
jgi:putative endonuclease